jgi:hypothetical protein
MIAGMVAIVQHKFNQASSSLTSTHSWIGVISVALYGLNFLWGLLMFFLVSFFPGIMHI